MEPTFDRDVRSTLESLQVRKQDLTQPGTVVQLGVPPWRIDLMMTISGVPDFASAWAGRRAFDFQGRSVPFLGRAELIANKRAAGRTKDLADLDALGELT